MLHVELDGEGPALVLLHGFTGSTVTWRPLVASVRPRFTTVAVDLPGHGRSTAPADPSRYSLPRLAADLARLLDTLDLERAALLGYSLGGRAALHFALSHGTRLSALVLESTSAGIDDPAELGARARADAELADFIEREGIESFVDQWETLPFWSSQSALPEAARASLRAQRLDNSAQGLSRSLRGAGAGSMKALTSRLGDIDATTLLIAGALDAKYVAAARAMKHAIPRAELAIIENAGHAAHFERPEEFARRVEDFLLRKAAGGDRSG